MQLTLVSISLQKVFLIFKKCRSKVPQLVSLKTLFLFKTT